MGVCIPISVKSQFKKKVPRFTIFLAVLRVRLFNCISNCEPCSGLMIRCQMSDEDSFPVTFLKFERHESCLYLNINP